jgi:hypothetical protein
VGGRSLGRIGVQTKTQNAINVAAWIGNDLGRLHGCYLGRGLAILDDIGWIVIANGEGKESVSGKFEDDTS